MAVPHMNPAYGMRDERARRAVRRIFAQAASGRTLTEIRDMLNSYGTRSPKGGEWTRSMVRRIIRNERYCHEEPDIPALVTERVWEKAQAIVPHRPSEMMS